MRNFVSFRILCWAHYLVASFASVRPQDVRIYTYRLPACSLEHFPGEEIDGRQPLRRKQFHDGRPPLLPIHRKLAYGRLATDDPRNATHFYIPAPFFFWDDSWHSANEACKATTSERVLDADQKMILLPGDVPDLRNAAWHCQQAGCVFGLWLQFTGVQADNEAYPILWILKFRQQGVKIDLGLKYGCPIISTDTETLVADCDREQITDQRWHHIGGMLRMDLSSTEMLLDFLPVASQFSIQSTTAEAAAPTSDFLGWRFWGIEVWREAVLSTLPPWRTAKPFQLMLQRCAVPSPMESSNGPCMQRVIDFVESQPWLKRRQGWDHLVLFAGVDYPSVFNPIHPPDEADFVLETRWPAFRNFVVLHFGARSERCVDRLESFHPAQRHALPDFKQCQRRVFQTVTIPPLFPNEDFNCAKMASYVQGRPRPHRLGFRGLSYNAMVERNALNQALSEAFLQQLQLTGDFRLEFTNWTHELLGTGVCKADYAFDLLCSWSSVNRPAFNQSHSSSQRVQKMRSRALELWESSEAGLVLPGDGGYELRLYSMLNKATVPFIVASTGSTHAKIPFSATLHWSRFAVFWDLSSSFVTIEAPTRLQHSVSVGAHRLLLQAALMDPQVLKRKRRNLLRYAPGLSWEDHAPCPGTLRKTALDFLAQELAHRLSKYEATGAGLTGITGLALHDRSWKIPDKHVLNSEQEDLTGTGCPAGYPLCEKHESGNVCVAPCYGGPFACPLGCKLMADRPPWCRTSAGAACNAPIAGRTAIPCGTYPDRNFHAQVLPYAENIVRRPRIALLTWSDRKELAKLTKPALERFCQEHEGRYDLIVEEEPILGKSSNYAPAWNKVVFLRRLLRTTLYDAVVWIDDDILITEPGRDPVYEGLKRSILALHSDVFLYASKDVRVDARVPMNTGILGLRASRRARKFLEELLRISRQKVVFDGQALVPQKQGWWDQDAVAAWVRKNGLKDAYLEEHRTIQSIVRDLSNGHWMPGDFAAHFSAAVAMDAALHMPATPAALGFFSGSLMCRRRWRDRLPLLKGWRDLALVQGHGRGDWAVGVNGGRWMRDFCRDEIEMQQAEYHEFQGGHTIPPDLADRFIEMLLRIQKSARRAAIAVGLASILLKEALYRATLSAGEQVATAWHHRSDSLAAGVALASQLGGAVGAWQGFDPLGHRALNLNGQPVI
eukprot:s2156_g4.t1